jgi:hypothetical protein
MVAALPRTSGAGGRLTRSRSEDLWWNSSHLEVPRLADSFRNRRWPPLPNPPVVSVMRELDSSCNELRAADPQFHIEGRRGPGPNVSTGGFAPTAAAGPDLKPPFAPKTFTLTYDFDSELAGRTIGEALKAVQYAGASHARRVTIIGYRAPHCSPTGRCCAKSSSLPASERKSWRRRSTRLGSPATPSSACAGRVRLRCPTG